MGLFSHERSFGYRYITAIILAGGQFAHVIQVRNMLTPHLWLAKINDKSYIFSLGGSGIYTWAQKGAMAAKIVIYDIRSAYPIDELTGDLQALLKELRMPEAGMQFADLLRGLRRGKDENTIEQYIKSLGGDKASPDHIRRIQSWIDANVGDKIIQPLNTLSRMLDNTVIHPNPRILGDLFSLGVEYGDKLPKLTNFAVTPKKSYILLVGIMMIVGIAAFVAYDQYESGAIQIPGIPGLPGVSLSDTTLDTCGSESLQDSYANTLDIAVAIELGDLDCAIEDLEPPFNDLVAAEEPEIVQWAADQERGNREAVDDILPIPIPDIPLP